MSERNPLKSNQERRGTSGKYPGGSMVPWATGICHRQAIMNWFSLSLGLCGVLCLLHSAPLFQLSLCFYVALTFFFFLYIVETLIPNLTSTSLLIFKTQQSLTRGPLHPIQVTAGENSHGIRCISPISYLTVNGLERQYSLKIMGRTESSFLQEMITKRGLPFSGLGHTVWWLGRRRER